MNGSIYERFHLWTRERQGRISGLPKGSPARGGHGCSIFNQHLQWIKNTVNTFCVSWGLGLPSNTTDGWKVTGPLFCIDSTEFRGACHGRSLPPSHPTPAQKCNVMAFPENGKCFRGNYCIVGQFKIDKNTFVWIAEILLVEIKEMLLGIYCWKIGMEPFLFCWNVVMLLGEMMIWSVAWC